MANTRHRPLIVLSTLLVVLGCRRPESDEPRRPGDSAVHEPKEITTPSGIAMIAVPAGSFAMGDNRGADDEKLEHVVHISAFCIDKYEVTQEAYENLMGRNPSKFKGPTHPVERLSWFAAIKYCNMRSLREGLRPCYDLDTQHCDVSADGYRLPTETEWEYACRAGTTTVYSFGNRQASLKNYGWFKDNANKTTHPVGQKKANPWGLYDMHGNVLEWCNDFYAEDAYRSYPAKDPHGPVSGEERVLRGGGWRTSADGCRSAARHSETPGFADVCFGYEAYGFRCVRRAPSEPPE